MGAEVSDGVSDLGSEVSSLVAIFLGGPGSNMASVLHRWDLPVLRYHKVMVIYPYHFLVVIDQLFSCIIFINDCICTLTGSPG